MKLGKKPARLDAVSFKFARYFDRSKLPTPPLVFGHEKIGAPWQTLSNDKFGDCVWAGAAHETMVWTHEAGKTATFRDADVLADYTAVTGFDPSNPDTDQGTDMTDAASYRRKTGIRDANGVRHTIDSYVALQPGNFDDLMLAAYLTGAAGVGIQFPTSAMDQFDAGKPWDPVKGSRIDGGHYLACIGRNHNGDALVITWGRIQAMTRAFYERYNDESLAYLSVEIMRDKVSPEGFDVITLQDDINNLRA